MTDDPHGPTGRRGRAVLDDGDHTRPQDLHPGAFSGRSLVDHVTGRRENPDLAARRGDRDVAGHDGECEARRVRRPGVCECGGQRRRRLEPPSDSARARIFRDDDEVALVAARRHDGEPVEQSHRRGRRDRLVVLRQLPAGHRVEHDEARERRRDGSRGTVGVAQERGVGHQADDLGRLRSLVDRARRCSARTPRLRGGVRGAQDRRPHHLAGPRADRPGCTFARFVDVRPDAQVTEGPACQGVDHGPVARRPERADRRVHRREHPGDRREV
jgi:hypothetical protein